MGQGLVEFLNLHQLAHIRLFWTFSYYYSGNSAIRSLKEVDPQVTLIYAALKDLPEFTMTTRVRAAKKIVQSQTHVTLFFSMDEDDRKEFVRSILAE